MPPKKRGGKGAKASPRGKGRGKAKAVEEVVEEEQNTEEEESSQPEPEADAEAEPEAEPEVVEEPEQEMEVEESEPTSQDAAGDTSLTNGKKRKAEEEEAEGGDELLAEENESEEPSKKKVKTEEKKEEEPPIVTLVCSDLKEDVTEESLKEFFESNDVPVTNVKKEESKSTGQVDVDKENVDKALELSGNELDGEAIKIEKMPKPSKSNPSGDDRTLFIKNLTESCTEDTLKEFFAGEGIEITEVRLPRKRDGLCKGFGYVVFATIEQMEEGIKEKQGEELNGEKVFLDYTNDKSGFKGKDRKGLREFGASRLRLASPSKVLFVRNLAFSVSEAELKETFDGCVAVRIPPNEYGQPKGFGFVEFDTVEEAEVAQKDKDGLEINGRIVQLAFANDKPTGLGGGGGIAGYGGGRGGGWSDRGRGGWGGGGGRGWGGGGGRGWGGGGRGGWGGGGGRGGWGGGRGGWGGGGGGRGFGGGRGRGRGGRGGGDRGFRKKY